MTDGRRLAILLAAIFLPLLLFAALLCAAASGGAEHNNLAVEASFYGGDMPNSVPREFKEHIRDMQTAFSRLDAAVSAANGSAENGNGLDPQLVKAIFYALCFGEEAPGRREANRFVGCFFTSEQREIPMQSLQEDGTAVQTTELRTVTVPASLEQAYENLAELLGREITDEDRENAQHIYMMVAGSPVGSSYDGEVLYSPMPGGSAELDTDAFVNPAGKNNRDLAAYAIHAYEEHWGYVWGTFGWILTEELFQSKLEQYPDALSGSADFIRENWVGRRTTDCVGLIKGYGWLDAETQEIRYGTNGMPDISANQMYRNAAVSGTIDTIPEIPGLAVWHDGHIGVYIGGGYVIEAMGTRYGVCKTKLQGRGWTHWLQIPYLSYS